MGCCCKTAWCQGCIYSSHELTSGFIRATSVIDTSINSMSNSPAPEVPDLNQGVVPVAASATAIPATASLAECWGTDKRVRVSSRETSAADRATNHDARHGRVGSHWVPEQHLTVGALHELVGVAQKAGRVFDFDGRHISCRCQLAIPYCCCRASERD